MAAGVASGQTRPPAPAAAWRAAAAGLQVRTCEPGRAEWPQLVLLVRVPKSLALHVVAASGDALLDAPGAVLQGHAVAAINGGFFDTQSRPVGWLVADGVSVHAPSRSGWGALAVSRGLPAIVAGDALPIAGAEQGVQAGPRLVVQGVARNLGARLARRAFVGLDREGRVVLGVTGPLPCSLQALARYLAAPESEGGAGLVDALNLDGGSSAQLAVRGADGDSDIVFPGVQVPDLLVVTAP